MPRTSSEKGDLCTVRTHKQFNRRPLNYIVALVGCLLSVSEKLVIVVANLKQQAKQVGNIHLLGITYKYLLREDRDY